MPGSVSITRQPWERTGELHNRARGLCRAMMFNFSANNLILRAEKTTEMFTCFTMLDRHTKRTYLLYD